MVEDSYGIRFVVGIGSLGIIERLLIDNGISRFVVDVEVIGRVLEFVGSRSKDGLFFSENRISEGIFGSVINESRYVVEFGVFVDVDLCR